MTLSTISSGTISENLIHTYREEPPTSDTVLLSHASEAEYCSALNDPDASSSQHENRLCAFIQEHVLSQNNYKSFLDIGAGPGHIMEKLISSFERATVLDPNRDYLPFYEKIQETHPLRVITGNFPQVEIKEQYDFALCSHMFYYIPQSEWDVAFDQLLNSLNRGGKALITMVGARGPWHELCESIQPGYSNGEKIQEFLNDHRVPFTVSKISCEYTTDCHENIFSLFKLFVLDDCFTPEEYQGFSQERKNEIDQKILGLVNSCMTEQGTYEFHTEEDYILITKN